ncbi:hypothetical protein [Anabaena azotica]|uniref:Uncharacterized protein n=1 Tax=Anabaena azotica FACHB-119 TaxID=947527 RepID=A0ABR8DG83_9NOST|nr:hypothetical protein [Anabaena azotica]MBD2505543.1 hypothetical protein [Anabaena azotica FACHB-119]
MTKLGYNAKSQEYIVSELGQIVDSDPNLEALAQRNNFFSVNDEEKEAHTKEETVKTE